MAEGEAALRHEDILQEQRFHQTMKEIHDLLGKLQKEHCGVLRKLSALSQDGTKPKGVHEGVRPQQWLNSPRLGHDVQDSFKWESSGEPHFTEKSQGVAESEPAPKINGYSGQEHVLALTSSPAAPEGAERLISGHKAREVWARLPDEEQLDDAGHSQISLQEVGGSMRTVSTIERAVTDRSNTCYIDPNSQRKLSWDVAGMILLTVDMVLIPFVLAFEPDKGWFFMAVDWSTLIFWTFDMIFSSFTAFYITNGKHTELVTSRREILKAYLLGWFLLDLPVVGIDWFMSIASLITESGGSDSKLASVGRLLRGLRVLRVLRLLRLAKLKQLMGRMYDMIPSEYMFLVVNLLKLMACLLVINHWVACLWFLIGRQGREVRGENTYANWIDRYVNQYETGAPYDLYDESSKTAVQIAWEYTTSLHWSLCQFTPAGMEVVAQNLTERIFSVMIVCFALAIYSSMLGAVTASITALRSISNESTKQFWMLRRYLNHKNIDRHTQIRLMRYLEHKDQERLTTVHPPTIIDTLSEPLKHLLAWSLWKTSVKSHVLFKELADKRSELMHELCTEAFDGTAFGEDDVIFQPGQAGRYMYIGGGHDDPSRSILTYIRQRKVERLSVSTVFIAEAVLWTNWKHEGKLTANQPLVMLRVKWKQFGEVVEQDAAAFRVARAHCERFLKELDAGRVKEVENDTCSISFNSREGTQSDSVA
jgi:hypothetical protein